jgi:hypothetical protein
MMRTKKDRCKMEKEINHMQKGLEVIAYSMLFVLLIFVAYHYYRLAWSDLFFNIHKKDSMEWQLDSFGNIAIPRQVSVYFVTKIKYPYLIFDNDDVRGFYLSSKRTIFIRDSLSDEEKESTLVHELAHDSYYNFFTDDMRDVQEQVYDIVCENAGEYYAHTEQFAYERMRGGNHGIIS